MVKSKEIYACPDSVLLGMEPKELIAQSGTVEAERDDYNLIEW